MKEKYWHIFNGYPVVLYKIRHNMDNLQNYIYIPATTILVRIKPLKNLSVLVLPIHEMQRRGAY